jgi:hypothetical protein
MRRSSAGIRRPQPTWRTTVRDRSKMLKKEMLALLRASGVSPHLVYAY